MFKKDVSVVLSTDLSEFIISLFVGAREKSVKEFKPWVFEHIQKIVQFDSGLWVSRSDIDNPINEYWSEDTWLFNQPLSFMENYQRLAMLPDNIDPLYQLVVTNPERVVSLWEAYDCRNEWNKTNYYLEHSKLFNIENMLSIYMPSGKYTSVMHALSFYRKGIDNDFSALDRSYINILVPILVEAFRMNILNSFTSNWENTKAYKGVTDRWGTVIEVENGFIDLLKKYDLLNDDNKINRDITQLINSRDLKDKGLELQIDLHNGIAYIEAKNLDLSTVTLSPMQSVVAKYAAAGLSDKLIAKKTNKSISNVRYHKKNIAKLYNIELNSSDLSYILRQ